MAVLESPSPLSSTALSLGAFLGPAGPLPPFFSFPGPEEAPAGFRGPKHTKNHT